MKVSLVFVKEDLAHDAGLHRTYVGLIERGLRNPIIEVGHALALALGTTPLRPDSTSRATALTGVALGRASVSGTIATVIRKGDRVSQG